MNMQMTDAEYAQLIAETDQVLLDITVKKINGINLKQDNYKAIKQIQMDAEYAQRIVLTEEHIASAPIAEEKDFNEFKMSPTIVQCPNCGIYIDVEINCSIFRCAFITEFGINMTKDQIAHASLEQLLKWRDEGIIHADIGCLVPFRVANIGATPYILYKNGNLDYNS
jgi:uncharacterized protein (UPF0276 family)